MNLQEAIAPYRAGFVELSSMIRSTEAEIIGGENVSPLILENINFFTKSFLISACAHLEICIKQIVYELALDIDARLNLALIPSSVIDWRFNVKKKNDVSDDFISLLIRMTKKEIDDLVSGNVYRTKDALAIVGVDVTLEKDEWEDWKEKIQLIVTRRNNIVHHNDDASDISLGDVFEYISSIGGYLDFLINACHRRSD